MSRSILSALGLALLFAPSAALAQDQAPPPAPPGAEPAGPPGRAPQGVGPGVAQAQPGAPPPQAPVYGPAPGYNAPYPAAPPQQQPAALPPNEEGEDQYAPPPTPSPRRAPPRMRRQDPEEPPPPSSHEGPQWNVRWNPIDLIDGRVTLAGEYSVIGPLSIALLPMYRFSKPVYFEDKGLQNSGWGIGSEVGLWVDGRPFNGTFLKGHFMHESNTYKVDVPGYSDSNTLGANWLGFLFGSQTTHGGWFTFSTGIGVAKNLSYDQNKSVPCPTSDGQALEPGGCQDYLGKGLGAGWDIIGEIAIGVVF